MEINEENFYELYEQYLDNELMIDKVDDVELEEKKISSKNHKSPFTKENTVSIGTFVEDYLGLNVNAKKLYHSGLKELEIPYVVGVANDFADKNPELVYQRYLILVLDYKNNRGTYINPSILKKLIEKDDIEKEFRVLTKQRLTDIKKLDEYYNKYIELKGKVDTNEIYYKFLKEARKLRKLNEIKEYENKGENKDEYKRK